jgi:type IV pilus assembly protein PilB
MGQILSRLKVLAHVDIAERRVPQDGKFRAQINGRSVDLRVSTFPSLYGEKIVVRILDRLKNAIQIDTLGFAPSTLTQFKDLISRSNGFILVTGPTGSGKTTTLYAALSQLNAPEKNIITLEDPVEYNLDGITQGQIHPDAGFTFERGIRAVLRQDPDIAMIGEIRDQQTAQVGMQAALTGHLVFSTLHTNDAPSAIMRLMDMGIEPFLINAAVTGVLAQRLARKICNDCRLQVNPTAEDTKLAESLGIATSALFKGAGCASCNNLGYKGRTGIYELLPMTSSLRSLIVKQPNFDDINAQARADGMQTLLQDGSAKVQQGIITLQELMRAVV